MRLNTTSLNKGLAGLEGKKTLALHMFCDTASKKLQSYARANAPWTDRSGAARQRLICDYSLTQKGARIELAHGVDYGVWLEVAHEEKYAILQPTITHMSPEVMRGFNRLLEKV